MAERARRPGPGTPRVDVAASGETDLPESQENAQDSGSDEAADAAPRARTRAEEMGIPPIWAVGGEKGKSKELRKQLEAAEEALESARRESRDANEKYLRTAAEMENMRRRHQKDRQDQLLYGNAELITRILPLLDNFHRALDHAPESAESDPVVQQWVQGLQLVVRQFEEILAGAGVEPIEAVGRSFDPSEHQAVMAEPSDQHEDGQVIAELQRGYRLRDRVLRPTMVKVANNS
jgi:molecular chaperone GrpE